MPKNITIEEAKKEAGTDKSKKVEKGEIEKRLKVGEVRARCEIHKRVEICTQINKMPVCRKCMGQYKDILAERKAKRELKKRGGEDGEG